MQSCIYVCGSIYWCTLIYNLCILYNCRYKSRSYRARVVREPRRVLSEFGTNIPSNVSIVVHDATADCRYIVLPTPPLEVKHLIDAYKAQHQLEDIDIKHPKTEELMLSIKKFATRDSMVGVAVL